MLAFFVLLLNFISLAGIVIGLLMTSERVRGALEAAYIHSDDLALGRASSQFADQLIQAVLRTVVLDEKCQISLWKMVVIAAISSVILGSALAPTIEQNNHSVDPAFIVLYSYTLGFAGHFAFDYLALWLLLKISSSVTYRSASTQVFLLLSSLILITAIPPALAIAFYALDATLSASQFALPVAIKRTIKMALLINGPTLAWAFILKDFLHPSILFLSSISSFFLFVLSSIVAASIAFFEVIARQITRSPRAMKVISQWLLRISQADSKALLGASCTGFGVVNGLCQLLNVTL